MYKKKKIAVFHWGQISIHTFYLVEQIQKSNIDVDLYLYSPSYANKSILLQRMIADLNNIVKVIEFKPTRFETNIIRINHIFKKFKKQLPIFCINPFLPFRTRLQFDSKKYDFIITVTQSSLYWLAKTSKLALHKTIHYSLEIEKVSDPSIQMVSCIHALIKMETMLLRRVKALLIQDKERADALLDVLEENGINRIYFPVSVPGDIIENKSLYLHEKLRISNNQSILLYFGAVYQERMVDQLVDCFQTFQRKDICLVLHGAGEFSSLTKEIPNARSSNEMIAFGEIYKIISSASIGIAFYDNGWPNNKLTAFSSEKIARYLQAGVPFIALKNENYLKLKNEFDCCMLIEEFDELENAVDTIMANYEYYRQNSFKAYEKYYNIENSIKPLVDFMKQREVYEDQGKE